MSTLYSEEEDMRGVHMSLGFAVALAAARSIKVGFAEEEIGLRPDHVPRPPDSTVPKSAEFLQFVEPLSIYRIVDGPRSPRDTRALRRPRRKKKR